MKIIQLMKELSKENIQTSIKYDSCLDKCYLDLNTQAKSDLYLYEDGILRGRYNYEVEIDLNGSLQNIVICLCHEFKSALCGRNYFNQNWANLCSLKGIKLGELHG